MTDIKHIQNQLVDFMEKGLHLIVPSVRTDLFEMGGLDSLVFVELIMLLEREFGIKIEIQEIELDNFKSVATIAEFISSQQQHKQDKSQQYAQISGNGHGS